MLRLRVLYTLFLSLLFAYVANADKEDPDVTGVSVAVSATLIGAVTFMMGLFYCTNHSDQDMRKYTYCIISETISIFCAVLWFQMCDDLWDRLLLDGQTEENKVICNFIHMIFWFLLLQCSLGYISGAFSSCEEEEKMLSRIEQVKLDLKFYSVLLAHVTGFAAINAWGSLQQLPYFQQNMYYPYLVVLFSSVGQFLLQRACDAVRFRFQMQGDGEVDELESMWNEETIEAEVDVMALCVSFNAMQAMRFTISAVFPDDEGKEPWFFLCHHSNAEVFELMCLGFLDLMCLMVCYFIKDKILNAKSEEEKEELEDSMMMVLLDCAITTCSMIFAWCLFYSGQWTIAMYLYNSHDEILLAVLLTMFVSLSSFALISVLDKIADAEWSGDQMDHAVRRIINSLSLLVGFAWEQCFDRAVNALAMGSDEMYPGHHVRDLSKIVLTLFVVLLVAPAWKKFLLPMVLQEGWETGFVLNDVTIERLARAVSSKHLEQMHIHRTTTCGLAAWDLMKDQRPSGACTCGNIFMDDSFFCRKCGTRRPQDDVACPGNCGYKVTWHPTHCCARCATKKGCHGKSCDRTPAFKGMVNRVMNLQTLTKQTQPAQSDGTVLLEAPLLETVEERPQFCRKSTCRKSCICRKSVCREGLFTFEGGQEEEEEEEEGKEEERVVVESSYQPPLPPPPQAEDKSSQDASDLRALMQEQKQLQSQARDREERQRSDFSAFGVRMGTMLDTMALIETKIRQVSPAPSPNRTSSYADDAACAFRHRTPWQAQPPSWPPALDTDSTGTMGLAHPQSWQPHRTPWQVQQDLGLSPGSPQPTLASTSSPTLLGLGGIYGSSGARTDWRSSSMAGQVLPDLKPSPLAGLGSAYTGRDPTPPWRDRTPPYRDPLPPYASAGSLLSSAPPRQVSPWSGEAMG